MKTNIPKEMKTELNEDHGTCAPWFKTVCNWLNKPVRDIQLRQRRQKSSKKFKI